VPGVAAAYLVVGWITWQVVDIAAPALGLPDWTLTLVILVTIAGFPVALVLAWAYDLTPKGVVRTAPAGTPAPSPEPSGEDPAEAWKRVEEALHQALEIPEGRRGRHLEDLKARHPELHREVVSLLKAHDEAAPIDALRDWVADAPIDPRLEPGSMIAQYRLVKHLGGGGMGVVYQAVDTRLDRTVALKFLGTQLGSDPSARERFLVEARSAAALDHPHICTVLEIGETPAGRPFIAMPYYDGETLKDRVRRGPLAISEALEIAGQLARGLEAAHRLGIVHRDMKPANVMITPDGIAKIVDFGIAKMTDVAITQTGSTIGTLAYMSPEQASGEQVDHRTDLWSLGVILYEMLTGTRPFSGSSEQAVRKAILEASPAPLPPGTSEAVPRLQGILERAMSRDLDRRYASAAELASDLEAAATLGETGEHAITTQALVPGGERRICTVLVAHIGGYDALLDELGPAEHDQLTERLRAAANEVVTARGGTLRRVDGPRFQAVFGVPVTHEDDCVRAVASACAIQERLSRIGDELVDRVGHGFAVASGIDTGQVATRSGGEAGSAYQLSGRPLRVADELARRAEPGTVLLTGESRRLVSGVYDTAETARFELVGEERPVTAYVMLGEKDEEITGGQWGGERRVSEFTGRQEEIASVRAAASRTLQGEGQFVEISGEPGMGKSRMLHELVHGPGAWRFRILFGRSSSVSRSQSYLPFIDVFRNFLEEESCELTADGVIRRVLEIDEGLADALPYVLQLLSLSDERYPFPKLHGDQLRLAVLEAIAGVLTALSAERPLALLLEDWHWADEASHAALLRLLELVPAFQLIVIVTYRPGYRVEFRDIPNTTSVLLGPVDAAESVALFRCAIGARSVSPELAELVVKRIGGNPFFIEEIAASLKEEGTVCVVDGRARLTRPDSVRLPDSVHAVIRTRLDRIDPEARAVLLKASVIGDQFPREVLARLTDADTSLDRALATLKKAGLIQQTKVLPDAEFRFKHALTLEVTYESLLSVHRRELHRKVGELLEARGPTPEGPLDRLAYHFGQAGEWRKAVTYGFEAAQRAMLLSENGEAGTILDRVEKWAEHLESSTEVDRLRIDILLERERVHDLIGQRRGQRAAIERLRTLLGACGTEADWLELHLREADLLTSTGRYAEGEPILLDALDRSKAHGDPVLRRKTLRSRGMQLWYQGRGEEALEVLEEAVAIDRSLEDIEGEIVDLQNIVRVHRTLGHHHEALGLALELSALAEESGADPLSSGYAANLLGLCYASVGELDRAVELFEEIRIQLREQDYLVQGAFSLNSLAHLYLQKGRIDDAVATYEESVALARRSRDDAGLAQALHAFATVALGLGDVEPAIEYLSEAAPIFGQLEDEAMRLKVTAQLAELYEEVERPQDAMAAWGSVRQWARELGDASGEVAALEGLARATRMHLGDATVALPHYEEALGKARELGDPEVVGRLLNTLGVLAWERGAYREAADYYEEALVAFREAGESEGVSLALASLASTYGRLSDAKLALARAMESVETSRAGGHRRITGYALALLGDLELEAGDVETAEEAYRESLDIRRELADERGEGWMLYKLSKVEERRGALDRVRDLASRAYGIASRVGDQALLEACTAQERY
jgi:serine/threonine protein kinase/tetratricopeptide (TPR) repeat protein